MSFSKVLQVHKLLRFIKRRLMEGKKHHFQNENICRTCLSASDLSPIFVPNSPEISVPDKIMECTSIQIMEDDGLPSNICEVCLKQLNDAYVFRKKCLETNSILQERKMAVKDEEITTEELDLDFKYESDHSGKSEEKHNEKQSPKRIKCEFCDKEFRTNHIYRHMRIHTQEKPFSCNICGKQFNTGYNRDRHLKTHTGEKPFKCNECGKAFIQAVTLQAHLRVHTGETPYTCEHCGKAFKQIALCRLHIQRRHINPQQPTVRKKRTTIIKKNLDCKYSCDLCERSFTTRSSLYAHKLLHGEKTFLCSECGKRFISQVALRSHAIVHSGEKQYTCNICDKSFAYKCSLKTHLLRHSGEKRYSCHLCGSKFLQSAHLNTHLKLHEGTKPFKCTVCDKDFSLKGNLTVHMRIHTGETPHHCPICKRGFYDSSSMRKHYQGHTTVQLK